MYHIFAAKCQADFLLAQGSDHRNRPLAAGISHQLSPIHRPRFACLDQCRDASFTRPERFLDLCKSNQNLAGTSGKAQGLDATLDNKALDLVGKVRGTNSGALRRFRELATLACLLDKLAL